MSIENININEICDEKLAGVSGGMESGRTVSVTYVLTYRRPDGIVDTKEFVGVGAFEEGAMNNAGWQANDFLAAIGGTFISLDRKRG